MNNKTTSRTLRIGSRFLMLQLCVVCPIDADAQSTLFASNLEASTVRTREIAQDSWIGVPFITGSNFEGYTLDSIQLLMSDATGSPNGFNLSLYASIDEGAIGTPDTGNKIGDLRGDNPLLNGVFTYEAVGLELSPSTRYFIIASASEPSVTGGFNWNESSTSTFSGSDGWVLAGGRLESSNGIDWSLGGRERLQYAVYATAIPEPSTISLVGLGGLIIFGRILRQNKLRRHGRGRE